MISEYIWDMDTQVELAINRLYSIKGRLEMCKAMDSNSEKRIHIITHDLPPNGIACRNIFIYTILKYTNVNIYILSTQFVENVVNEIRTILEQCLGSDVLVIGNEIQIPKYDIVLYFKGFRPRIEFTENAIIYLEDYKTDYMDILYTLSLLVQSNVKRIIMPFYHQYDRQYDDSICTLTYSQLSKIERLDIRSQR